MGHRGPWRPHLPRSPACTRALQARRVMALGAALRSPLPWPFLARGERVGGGGCRHLELFLLRWAQTRWALTPLMQKSLETKGRRCPSAPDKAANKQGRNPGTKGSPHPELIYLPQSPFRERWGRGKCRFGGRLLQGKIGLASARPLLPHNRHKKEGGVLGGGKNPPPPPVQQGRSGAFPNAKRLPGFLTADTGRRERNWGRGREGRGCGVLRGTPKTCVCVG